MCASPGGKSSQLACALRGGLLVSNEIDRSRAEVLRENIVRMGYDNVTVLSMRPDRGRVAVRRLFRRGRRGRAPARARA